MVKSRQLEITFQNSDDRLYGQFTRLACLIDKEEDFRAELMYFATIAPDQPALVGLFSRLP
jgi:hypothetical protein